MTSHLPGLLLVALLFVSEGHSIKCYSCRTNINNTVCNEGGAIQCSGNSHDACATITIQQGSTYLLTKKCMNFEECKAINIYDFNGRVTILCCQTNGCNFNAAPRPVGAAHVTLALLGVAISAVVSRALV
ncbi:prostate and testis expressed protein 3-like [Petromyzon marinus]|uniref:Lymphocyte antigen 6E-like n=1 Tax=Petromyzon marinus TaxID=7757 RepID=A0AAJ7UHJ8_PETMA|nr:lymphocyte antigen 6E-like [Petromyzon marinus]